jgi:hypothetical protein
MFSSRKHYCYGKIRSMKADGDHRAFITSDLIVNQIIEMLTIVTYENKLIILKTNYNIRGVFI